MTKSTVIGTYSRTDIGVSVLGQNGSRLYGSKVSNSHWCYSDDSGDNWTDTGTATTTNPSNTVIELLFFGSYMYAVTSDGKIYRNTPEVWTGWVEKSVSAAPVGTTGRPSVLACNGAYLFYGNYNASSPGESHIWRSADNGNNWTEVLSVPTARHVHAVAVDPSNLAHIFVTLGDASHAGKGLYYSSDSGANWTRISSNRYGIDMAFNPVVGLIPARILMEGDGTNQPHIMHYLQQNVGTPSDTYGAVWPNSTWLGTVRGIKLTSEGNLFYISTSESGVVGTKDGVWVARGPLFVHDAALLEDITAATWIYEKTYECGGYLFNFTKRMAKVKFEGQ